MTLELNIEEIMQEAVDKASTLVQSNPSIAEALLMQLLKCDPDHADGLQLLGLVKHTMQKHEEAIEIITRALEINPENAENHNNIALAYACLDDYDKAIFHLTKALEIKPNNYLFLNNLALQYRQSGQHTEAVRLLTNALKIENAPQMWVNLGGVYGELKDLEKAEKCFRIALEIDPDLAAAHVDLACTLALKGDLKNCFAEYEWRFDHFPQLQFYKKAYDQEKRWNGQQNLEDKTVLLYCEQGLGDAIQFARYIYKLKELGAKKIIVHCAKSLDNVMRRISGVADTINTDIVVSRREDLPEHDYHCSLMSLPHLLGCAEYLDSIYIRPIVTFKIKEQAAYRDTFNIGLSWAGSPAHPNDHLRSMYLKDFQMINDIPGVKLFNLQVDLRSRMYRNTRGVIDYNVGADNMRLVDLSRMIESFEDTATIVSGLDLVISVDTALVHLCGAMGVPCWALIPYNPDWRWGLDGETTGWYSSLRLFRQEKRGDWLPTIERMKEEINALILQNQR
jgi:tetratricopeptide (TPR) repeat protein